MAGSIMLNVHNADASHRDKKCCPAIPNMDSLPQLSFEVLPSLLLLAPG